MRLLPSTAPIFTASLVAISVCLCVQAQARVHHPAHKAASATPTSASATADSGSASSTAPGNANPGLNADGSIRAPTIADAPADDYQRVAWCHGILSGDMDLAVAINALQPTDPQIQTIGKSYLRAYEAALTLSGKGQTEEGHRQADFARQQGYDGWNGAMKAEIHKAALAYDDWQLPGDCEHAAVRLSGHPNLFAEMATDDEAKVIADTLASGGPHDYSELPKPTLTAHTVSGDSDAPIATNTLSMRAQQAAALPALPPVSDSSSSSSQSVAAPDTGVTPPPKTSWSEGLMQRLGWGKKKS